MAGAPLNLVSWSTVGPPLTKIRPWCPSDSQDTSDCGPPERSGVRGAGVSGFISLLTVAKVLFMVRIANLTTTPLSSAIVRATSSKHHDGRPKHGAAQSDRVADQENGPVCGSAGRSRRRVNSTTNDSAAVSG